jgi:hypothetical protein
MESKRSLGERIWRQFFRFFIAATAATTLAYALFAFTFYMRGSAVSRNYWQEINARRATPEDQRAWPLYRTAAVLIEQDDFEFIENHRHIGPQNESWPALVEILDRSQEILEVTRQAATLPALGYLYGDPEDAQAARDARANRLLAVDIALASENQSLLDTDLSGLNALRALARLLRVDAERAAIAGRGTDAVQNIRALVAMSEHVQQPGAFLIDQIVGVAIFGIAAETTGRLLAEYQNLFTEDELVQLLELFVNYRDGRIDVSFDTERIVFEDQLQRIYTDHGAGRGSITADGLFAITELNKTGWKAGSWIIAPFFAHLAAHREEERALFNESIDAQVAVRKGEPWTWDPDAIQAVENNLQQRSSKEPYCVLACLLG